MKFTNTFTPICDQYGRELTDWEGYIMVRPTDYMHDNIRHFEIWCKDCLLSSPTKKDYMNIFEAMEGKLRENDHKGGWENCKESYLTNRLYEEIEEFFDTKDVNELIDVANFAMMIWDNRQRKENS